MNDARLERIAGRYPDPEMSPAEFEHFVAEVLRAAETRVDAFCVTEHETVAGTDGAYDFDATVRFELLGAAFLVLIEAKTHQNPIKRELVQVLHQKVQSVGAHKGVMISTARYQGGAVNFAVAHGIGLVKVTEGRFTYEAKSQAEPPLMSREEAAAIFGTPTFLAHHFHSGDEPDSLAITAISPEYPECIAELLGVPERE